MKAMSPRMAWSVMRASTGVSAVCGGFGFGWGCVGAGAGGGEGAAAGVAVALAATGAACAVPCTVAGVTVEPAGAAAPEPAPGADPGAPLDGDWLWEPLLAALLAVSSAAFPDGVTAVAEAEGAVIGTEVALADGAVMGTAVAVCAYAVLPPHAAMKAANMPAIKAGAGHVLGSASRR